MAEKYILIANDDGVDAPGLAVLRQALASLYRIEVIAPQRNWSAAGHSKTMHKPLRIRHVQLCDGASAYACSGSPSDCIAVALLGYLQEMPALVISGINPGSNVGYDLTYSGTVTAAMEGAIGGVPAFSISLDVNERGAPVDFAPAAEFAARLATQILERGLPPDTFLNVNVPAIPREQICGVRVTRTGKRIYRDELVARVDPHGEKYYWIGGERPSGDAELIGTDIWALANNFISVTPVYMNMTAENLIEQVQSWFA